LLFNPCEFVLATTCKDRSVRFWDLETFLVLDTIGPEATAAHSCYFVGDGSTLLAAYQDSLKQYAYDPAATVKHIDVQWGHVVDLAMWNNNAVAASLNGPTVSVWCLEMEGVPNSALDVPLGIPPPLQEGKIPDSEKAVQRSGSGAPYQQHEAHGSSSLYAVERTRDSNGTSPGMIAEERQAAQGIRSDGNSYVHGHATNVASEALQVCCRGQIVSSVTCRQM
jgi:hypothetical protein